MQLNAILVALAAGCARCSCPRGALRETWGASLLARRAAQQPVSATLGSGDPSLTEALAIGLPDPAAPIPEDAAEVEMATANEDLVRMAVANVSAFEEHVAEKLQLICMAPRSQFFVRLQSDLGSSHTAVEDETVFKHVPSHPSVALVQRRALVERSGRHLLRRARVRQAAALNISAVMWVLFILPSNVTEAPNATNVTNVSNVTYCPPCPCAPKGAPPLFPGLSPNETAALASRSAAEIADDLVEQARGGDTPLHGLLPLTTVRRAHQNFPPISKNSVTIGARLSSSGALSDTGRAEEATEINQGTQELVKELRARLQAANEERAAILTGDQVPAPAFDGFTVPVAKAGEDPWSTIDFAPEPEPRLRGHAH